MGQKFIITESEKNYIRGLYSHILKEVEERNPPQTCQEWIEQNWSDKIPYTESYKRSKCKKDLQDYVMKRINELKPIEYAQSFLPAAKEFYINYFDYNKTPEILDKILTISEKNGKKTTKEIIIKTIDSMKTDLFGKVGFELDFTFNEKNPETIMYVVNDIESPMINICALSNILFVDDYKIGNPDEWKDSIQHELGHLIDFWFFANNILLHPQIVTKNGLIAYPHQNQSEDEFLNWGEYQRDTDEQFVRFKKLFDILSKNGLTISSDLSGFVNSIKKSIDNNEISFEGCSYTIENNVLKIDMNCESLQDRQLFIMSKGIKDNDLIYLFSNYSIVNEIDDPNSEVQKFDYRLDLNAMYNDWKNEYVQNSKKTNSATSSPNYPTA